MQIYLCAIRTGGQLLARSLFGLVAQLVRAND
jgi:hypothetical protein